MDTALACAKCGFDLDGLDVESMECTLEHLMFLCIHVSMRTPPIASVCTFKALFPVHMIAQIMCRWLAAPSIRQVIVIYIDFIARRIFAALQCSHRITPHRTLRITPVQIAYLCLLYTSPSPRDGLLSRMPSSA